MPNINCEKDTKIYFVAICNEQFLINFDSTSSKLQNSIENHWHEFQQTHRNATEIENGYETVFPCSRRQFIKSQNRPAKIFLFKMQLLQLNRKTISYLLNHYISSA